MYCGVFCFALFNKLLGSMSFVSLYLKDKNVSTEERKLPEMLL